MPSLTLDEMWARFESLQAENVRLSEENSKLQTRVDELTRKTEELEQDLDTMTVDRDYYKKKSAKRPSDAGEATGNVYSGNYVIGGSGNVHMGNKLTVSSSTSTATNQTFQRRW